MKEKHKSLKWHSYAPNISVDQTSNRNIKSEAHWRHKVSWTLGPGQDRAAGSFVLWGNRKEKFSLGIRVKSQALCLKPETGVALFLNYETRLKMLLLTVLRLQLIRGCWPNASWLSDWICDVPNVTIGPGLWPTNTDLILIWELQSQAETNMNLLDQHEKNKNHKKKET